VRKNVSLKSKKKLPTLANNWKLKIIKFMMKILFVQVKRLKVNEKVPSKKKKLQREANNWKIEPMKFMMKILSKLVKSLKVNKNVLVIIKKI
jgi:hypothetical protein